MYSPSQHPASINGGGQLSGARGVRHVHHARKTGERPASCGAYNEKTEAEGEKRAGHNARTFRTATVHCSSGRAMSLPPPPLPSMALDPRVLQMLGQPKLPLLGQFPPLRIPPLVKSEPIPHWHSSLPRRRASQWPEGQSARQSRRRLQRSPPSDGRRPVVLPVSTPCRSTTWADAIWVAG